MHIDMVLYIYIYIYIYMYVHAHKSIHSFSFEYCGSEWFAVSGGRFRNLLLNELSISA